MPTRTLKELRTLARSRGLRGYSSLSRSELELLLSRSGGENSAMPKKKSAKAPARKAPAPARAESPKPQKKARPTAPANVPPATAVAGTPKWEWTTDIQRQSTEEERVESAKYATVLPGGELPPTGKTDLSEDIDNLPPIAEPALCLLPQKPGVLHGYWVIPSNTVAHRGTLKLRLGRIAGDSLEIIDELALAHDRGHWYFHVDESADMGAVYLQLGYYEKDGQFVTAIRRGIARIPSLHASGKTDRLWWVSEEQFRAMYRRAGGNIRAGRLGWAASISSPGGAPGAPSSERLTWPGGISSQPK